MFVCLMTLDIANDRRARVGGKRKNLADRVNRHVHYAEQRLTQVQSNRDDSDTLGLHSARSDEKTNLNSRKNLIYRLKFDIVEINNPAGIVRRNATRNNAVGRRRTKINGLSRHRYREICSPIWSARRWYLAGDQALWSALRIGQRLIFGPKIVAPGWDLLRDMQGSWVGIESKPRRHIANGARNYLSSASIFI